MNRIYSPNFSINHSIISINDSGIVHRINNVLRMETGKKIELFNKQAEVFCVEIIKKTEKQIDVKLIKAYSEPKKRSSEIILAVAFPKGNRGEWIIEKATELGVKKIIILTTTRSIMKPGEGRINKWRQIAIHASEQSKRTEIPEISTGTIKDIKGKKVAAILGSKSTIQEILEETTQKNLDITYLVGPEGDWTEEEKTELIQLGASPATLGNNTLRVETAAIYGIAIISEWKKQKNIAS